MRLFTYARLKLLMRLDVPAPRQERLDSIARRLGLEPEEPQPSSLRHFSAPRLGLAPAAALLLMIIGGLLYLDFSASIDTSPLRHNAEMNRVALATTAQPPAEDDLFAVETPTNHAEATDDQLFAIVDADDIETVLLGMNDDELRPILAAWSGVIQ